MEVPTAIRRAGRLVKPLCYWEGHGWVVSGESLLQDGGSACSLPIPEQEDAEIERNCWIVTRAADLMGLSQQDTRAAIERVRLGQSPTAALLGYRPTRQR